MTANKEKPRSEKGDEDHQPLIIKAMDDEPRLQEGKDHPSLREDVAPTSTSASASAVLVSEVVETSSLLLTEDELLQIRASLIEQLTRSETDSRIEAALDAKVASVISSEVVLREFDNRLKNERQLMTQDMEAGLLAARQQALKHSEELRSRIKEKETELSRLEVDLRAAEAAWTKRKEIEAARKLEENLAQVERRQKEALELQAKQKEEQERIAREQKEVLGKGNTREKLAFAFGSSSQKGPSKTLPRPFL